MNAHFARIQAATAVAAAGPLADSRERPQFPRVAAESPFPPTAGKPQLLARFREELETLTGKVYGPLDSQAAAQQVVALVKARDVSRVLAWAPDQLGCPGLAEALAGAGLGLVSGNVPNDPNHTTVLAALAEIEVGLSGAQAALADTGSIILASGPGRPRNASLLPPLHIAVVPVAELYPTMQDWLAAGGAELAKSTANLVVVTGSSRTSDIELQLTLGMHGPIELHVVLVE